MLEDYEIESFVEVTTYRCNQDQPGYEDFRNNEM